MAAESNTADRLRSLHGASPDADAGLTQESMGRLSDNESGGSVAPPKLATAARSGSGARNGRETKPAGYQHASLDGVCRGSIRPVVIWDALP